MIWNSLLLIFPILILVVALRCYKKDGKWMNAFYSRMCFHDVARRLYVQLVMLLLILFQFIQIQTHISAIDTFIPLLITALLIRFSMAELVLYALKKRMIMVSVCSLVLVGLFIPHCFSMAVALEFYWWLPYSIHLVGLEAWWKVPMRYSLLLPYRGNLSPTIIEQHKTLYKQHLN